MAESVSRKHLIQEINELPECYLPVISSTIHHMKIFDEESNKGEENTLTSLRGIWKGSTISEESMIKARKSLSHLPVT